MISAEGQGVIAKARSELFSSLDKGVICPCCEKYCKSYLRKLHSEMASFLVRLVKENDSTNWTHIREIINSTGKAATDASYLVHWGLLEQRPSCSKVSKGYYKPTVKGIQFVNGEITVPSHVLLYNNKVLGFSENFVSISQALNSKFKVHELKFSILEPEISEPHNSPDDVYLY